MKKIISILTALCLIALLQLNLQAQPPRHFDGPPHRGPALEQFAEELGITDEQKAELKTLQEAHRSEMKALMEKEFESPEARREAMKKLRDTQHGAVEAVLTEAQLEKLEALRAEAQEKRQEMREENAGKHKAMRKEMKTYRETEILPVLREQRAKLETQLSPEDKATIATLRAKRAAQMQVRQDRPADPEKRGQRPELTDAQKAEWKADHEKVKALLEKYDSQITALMEEINKEREGWQEHNSEIAKKYAPEQWKEGRMHNRPAMKEEKADGEKRAARPGKEGMGHPPQGSGRGMGKASFLLMDPNAGTSPAAMAPADFAELRVFPNPSASRNTVAYELKEAGHYRVELRDKDGLVLQVLSNQYREAGDYREEIDLSAYAAGTYYVSIVGAEGVVSKKLVIAK